MQIRFFHTLAFAALAAFASGALLFAQRPPARAEVEAVRPFAGAVQRNTGQINVRADLAALEQAARTSGRVLIPLSDGRQIVAALTHFVPQERGYFTAGPLVGGPAGLPVDGEATFTVVDDTLVGRIVSNGRLFMMRRAAGSSIHVITEIDQATFPPEAQPLVPPQPPTSGRGQFLVPDATPGGDTNSLVDLLVVYTSGARIEMGSAATIQAEITGAVNNANLALANAGVTHRLRLVNQQEVSYTETTASNDLNRLTNPIDGHLDDVHRLRDLHRADVVSLITTTASCGIAWLMGSASINVALFQDDAFNVDDWNCINANLTLAHEIGHNMGLHHDRKNANSAPAFPYGYGYRTVGSRDVMAYSCSGQETFSCEPRRTIFSTPLFFFPSTSTPAGVANSEDNARALNGTSSVVANFRDSTCTYVLSAAQTSFTSAGGTGAITVTTGSGCAWTAISSAPATVALSGSVSRTGSGSVGISVPANSGPPRTATLTAGGQSVVIAQASSCTASVALSSSVFGYAGGTATATITHPSGCGSPAWTAASDAAFATITSAATGSGDATVSFSVAANSGTASRTATLTIAGVALTITQTGPTVTPFPTAVNFRATKLGAAGILASATPVQTVAVLYSGPGTTSWTAVANVPWAQVTSGSGTGSGIFSVAILDPTNQIGASTSLSGAITITATNVGNSPVTVPITLTVDQTPSLTLAPFGQIDTPANGATNLSGAVAVTGWALDDMAVTRVEIWRNCVEAIDRPRGACTAPAPGALPNSVFIGQAAFLPGARPDVEALNPAYPFSYRTGWGLLVLTNALPHLTTLAPTGGQGAFTFAAYAVDAHGNYKLLGQRSVTLNNDTATTPFGAIDTPAQGGTVTTSVSQNFGWAMTKQPKCVEKTRFKVYVDGVSRTLTSGTNWFPNLSRSDLVAAYPGLCDTSSALAAYYMDAAALGLTNGLHTIGWDAYDDNGTPANPADDNVTGIGSRFFSLLVGSSDAAADRNSLVNGRPRGLGHAGALWWHATNGDRDVRLRVGPEEEPDQAVSADVDARRAVQLPAGGRLLLDLGGTVETGYEVVRDELRALPVGSTLDAAGGMFAWEPPIGFFGPFDLVFTGAGERIDVRVTIVDPAAASASSGIAMHIDLPAYDAITRSPLVVAGWALDSYAATGSGIDTMHVWAFRHDVPGIAPQFLGVATLGVRRPDVAHLFGAQFHSAGFQLVTPSLPPGTYDLVAYAWSHRTGRWEDARVVRVTLR